MKNFFLSICLSIFAIPALSQTVLEYNGGLNFKATQLKGLTGGVFLSPLVQLSFTPASFEDGQINFGNNVSVNFAEALSFGAIQPDPDLSTAVDVVPDFLIAVFGGDGFAQQTPTSILLNKGVIGVELGLPSILGDFMPGIAFTPSGGPIEAGFSYTTSFDVLDGLGVLKL